MEAGTKTRETGRTRDDGELRTRLHGMWSAVAGGWSEHADFVDARGAEVGSTMLGLVMPRPGERVLELACGPGGLGGTAAERVGPAGEVVLSDVAPEMIAIAAERARARGLGNVRTRELDLEEIDEPDAAYDVVLCREGMMFAADPARAAREMRRVLKPGGRFAVAVWGPRARNPWLGLVTDAVSEQVGHPVPPPGIPGVFSLEDAGELAELFWGAGMADVAVREVAVPLATRSFDEWWTRVSALAGPLAKILAGMPETAAQELRERARARSREYETPDGLAFPGVSLVANGRVR